MYRTTQAIVSILDLGPNSSFKVKKKKKNPSGYIPIYLGMGMYVSSDLSSKQVEHEWRYLQTAANRPTRGIKDMHHGVREGIESGKGKSRV